MESEDPGLPCHSIDPGGVAPWRIAATAEDVSRQAAIACIADDGVKESVVAGGEAEERAVMGIRIEKGTDFKEKRELEGHEEEVEDSGGADEEA